MRCGTWMHYGAKHPRTAPMSAPTAALLEHPLPWTKMRQVYRLLGLVRRTVRRFVSKRDRMYVLVSG